MKKRLVLLILSLFGLYLIVSFSRDLWQLWQKGGELEKTQLRLEKVQTENSKFKGQLEYAQSDQFLEKEARDKLGMAKEGETILILPDNLGQGIQNSNLPVQDKPNWEKWKELFF